MPSDWHGLVKASPCPAIDLVADSINDGLVATGSLFEWVSGCFEFEVIFLSEELEVDLRSFFTPDHFVGVSVEAVRRTLLYRGEYQGVCRNNCC